MDRVWIELRRAPEYDGDEAVAYSWAWGVVGGGRTNEPHSVDELIICRPSGSITYAGDPLEPHCATPVLCLLANHVRDTGELPEGLRYVQPELPKPTPPVSTSRTARRRVPDQSGLGLGTLGERANRTHAD